MRRCLLKCYQCSGKLLGYYTYRVHNALQGEADVTEVLNELSADIQAMLKLADKAKSISATCYQNINDWVQEFQMLQSQLQNIVTVEPINTS